VEKEASSFIIASNFITILTMLKPSYSLPFFTKSKDLHQHKTPELSTPSINQTKAFRQIIDLCCQCPLFTPRAWIQISYDATQQNSKDCIAQL